MRERQQSSRQEPYPPLDGLASVVACAVIEAVTRPEFVDGLWTGVQLVIRSGLQSVCTNPGGPPWAVRALASPFTKTGKPNSYAMSCVANLAMVLSSGLALRGLG